MASYMVGIIAFMLHYYEVKRLFAFAVFIGYGMFGTFAFLLFSLQQLSELELAIICSPYAAIGGVALGLFKDIVVDSEDSSIYHFTDSELRVFLDDFNDELAHVIASKGSQSYYLIVTSVYELIVRGIKYELKNETSYITREQFERFLDSRFRSSFAVHEGPIFSEKEIRYSLRRFLTWLKHQKTYVHDEQLAPWRYFIIVGSGLAYPISGILLLLATSTHYFQITSSELASATGLLSVIFASYWNSIVNEFMGVD